jgi:decaprenylphospho-beta-D-ribofuranose 2-oxidase
VVRSPAQCLPRRDARGPSDNGSVSTVQGELRRLTGWGRAPASVCRVLPVRSPEEAAEALAGAPARGAIARGLGRSYGALAQNGGGLVLETTGLDAIREFDREAGVVTVEAGCSLARLLDEIVPAGWFLPVTPGTRHVTVGGALACDVHGKNHHRDGSFGRHVLSLLLLAPEGELLRLDPAGAPEEFRATVGGLGLTGIVLEATLQLLPVETATMRVDVERAADLEDAFARLESGDDGYRYSVAWVDCRSRGARFGRSLLMRGDHARLDELPERERPAALRRGADRAVPVPRRASAGPLLRSRLGVGFNELYFRRGRERTGLLQPLDPFFYPLDALRDWNRLYGRAGFLQYQFVVPFGHEDAVVEILRLVRAAGPGPTLVVMKRFGEASGPLSFPLPGWTLALDLALPAPELARALDRADELVAGTGGRVYLAKDARLRPERLAEMYPELDAWRETQARLDPRGRMQGDLARRLGLARRRA